MIKSLLMWFYGDRIRDVSFEGTGCAISTASASMMTESLKGKTLAEAEAYLAEQDKGALERDEFYLDGPEEDKAPFDAGGLSMNPKTVVAAPTAAELAKVDSKCSPIPLKSPAVRGVWTRDIEALCRALEAQQ